MNDLMKTIPADALRRASERGICKSLDEFVTGLRYVRSIRDPKIGSRLDKNPGELFVNFDGGVGPKSWSGNDLNFALVGTPVGQMPGFPPSYWKDGGSRSPGSIRVVAWKPYGAALVIASDPNHIGDVWLGFIPIEALENVKVDEPA